MDIITFSVQGQPTGKARPRVTRSGITYTPKKTKDYENLIRWSFQAQKGLFQALEGPVEADIEAVFEIPRSTTKTNAEAMKKGQILPTKKPDIDNICKCVLDSLNGGYAYKDDAQVVKVSLFKRYCHENEYPHITVTIKRYEQKEGYCFGR